MRCSPKWKRGEGRERLDLTWFIYLFLSVDKYTENIRLKKMVTEEPELEAWGLYGVQAPHGPSRQTALEKDGPILQNKLIYREKKE